METSPGTVERTGQDSSSPGTLGDDSSLLAWRIPWTEEIGGLWDHKELDMTKAT